jgi:hypothetical protein
MRSLDVFDAPDDRPKLRECDQCSPGVVESDDHEFRECAACDEVTCPRHSAATFDDICAKCEKDARVCNRCRAFNVPCRQVLITDDGPHHWERLCRSCAPSAFICLEAWEGRYEAV